MTSTLQDAAREWLSHWPNSLASKDETVESLASLLALHVGREREECDEIVRTALVQLDIGTEEMLVTEICQGQINQTRKDISKAIRSRGG